MRITGGQHRSRTLSAPRGDATRPTSDRVREALFGILGSGMELAGARVLDLYAGTGALAFEALSRGAAHATLVESSGAAVQAIDANTRSLGLASRVRLLRAPVERTGALLAVTGPYDLVFADPPYAQVTSGETSRVLSALLVAPLLTPGARLVLEHGKADEPPAFQGFGLAESRRYGDTVLSFFTRDAPAPTRAPAEA